MFSVATHFILPLDESGDAPCVHDAGRKVILATLNAVGFRHASEHRVVRIALADAARAQCLRPAMLQPNLIARVVLPAGMR